MMKSVSVLVYLIVVLSLVLVQVLPQAEALEPPTAEQLAAYQRDGSIARRSEAAREIGNHRVDPVLARRAHWKVELLSRAAQGDKIALEQLTQAQGSAPPSGWAGMPTHGTVNVVAFLIDFQDMPHLSTDSVETVQSKLFGEGSDGYPHESLRNFYRRSSSDQLHIQGNALGWYTTPYPRSELPENGQGLQNLIKEVITFYDSQGHDFTPYDNDHDGVIDYMVFIWAGPHGEWASFWWGYMTEFYDSNFTVDGLQLGTYSWQWESYSYPQGRFTADVVIHETGHALGLPDYYDYDGSYGPDGGVGGLDQMDGNWGDHNCFSKFLLDWFLPETIVSGTGTMTLGAASSTNDAILVMPDVTAGDQFDEYFMIQNRFRDSSGNDVTYPTDGLLIWHVDAHLNNSGSSFRYDNSYSSHKLLRLMEADGREEIENGNGRADAADYYTIGDVFSPSTTPNSSRYDGSSTDITVNAISESGPVMTFGLSFNRQRWPIWRFYNRTTDSHFWTISESEKATLLAESSGTGWNLIGESWYAYNGPEEGTVPVYRFYSSVNQSHFYTIDTTERDRLIADPMPEQWSYEGVAWYDMPVGDSSGQNSAPVYRFWSGSAHRHFYTISESERDYITSNFDESVWKLEGIAWYGSPTQ